MDNTPGLIQHWCSLVKLTSNTLELTDTSQEEPRGRLRLHTLPLAKSSRPRLTHDSAVGVGGVSASFSGDGGGEGDDEALERSTWRLRARGREDTDRRVRRVGLGFIMPLPLPPPGRRERRGRRAEAAAAIAVRNEGWGGRFSRYPDGTISLCVTGW